jgi:aspartyl-tRNA(Asn)/glutamyl-tRNA(Gln) amidotransferase subunit A
MDCIIKNRRTNTYTTKGLDTKSVRDKIASGELSCICLTETILRQIDEGADLNAFISVFGDRTREKAEEIDGKIAEDRAGRLAGMIVAVKDNITMKDAITTCGSRILERFVSPYDATVIERLESEDAIIIGKTNMDEFGMGSSNENSAFGCVRNPYDLERTPGGSSGGSAAAVAAGMAMTALGSDTGGSVRQPAAFCGVVGFRPTYGRVSRYGLVAFGSSLDQIGCFANTVTDCAEALRVIAGHDPRDATSSAEPVPDYTTYLEKDITGLRVGIPREYFDEGLDDDVRGGVERIIDLLKEHRAIIKTVSLPHTEYGIAAYYLIADAEASSNLARYDGVRYGFVDHEASDLSSMYANTRSHGFGDEVKRRIMLGTYVLSAGYHEAYYRKAQRVRTLIRQDYERVFQKCDVLIGPTTPTTAFRLGEKFNDPLSMYLSDVYTVSASLAGVPAISIPIGCDTKGLPIGLQITGKPFGEGTILGVANWIEEALGPEH